MFWPGDAIHSHDPDMWPQPTEGSRHRQESTDSWAVPLLGYKPIWVQHRELSRRPKTLFYETSQNKALRRLTKIGVVVFLLHDVNDIFLESAKMARYAGGAGPTYV